MRQTRGRSYENDITMAKSTKQIEHRNVSIARRKKMVEI